MPRGVYIRKPGSHRPYPKGNLIKLTESSLNGPVKIIKSVDK